MGEDKQVIRGRLDAGGLVGPLWLIGWLFTIGYLQLHTVKVFYAILLWPYYLGVALR
jgi:hypothetical protein